MTAGSIQRIPYSAPREKFISALKKDGLVIVKDFTTLDVLEQARREVLPYLDADSENNKVGGMYQKRGYHQSTI